MLFLIIMDYQQTIDFLFSRLPMFSRIGAAAYKADLSNTLALCEFIGNPQTKFKSVHVAGTNGKGSVSHMLAAIFQAAGYTTGLYTSPHLKDFRERIKVNGEFVSTDFVMDFTSRIRPMIDQLEPSFFEITVAMAFDYFQRQGVDIAIVEVGLGGRLDSTNVILPELSVITNIGMDHMNLLGNTLELIAFEKAGIIKNNIPVVIGEYSPVTAPVFIEKAAAAKASLSFADQKRFVAEWKFQKHHLFAEVTTTHSNDKKYYELDLPGIYQIKNLVTVLESIALLRQDWKIEETHIHEALASVRRLTGLHGRWEIVHENPTVVLDVGHNEDGIRQIARQIELTDHEELHIVMGMVKDKNIDSILPLFPPHAHYYFTRAAIPRALPEHLLAEKARASGLKGNAYPDVNTALQAARAHARQKDLVVVCGSVFVVGDVIPF